MKSCIDDLWASNRNECNYNDYYKKKVPLKDLYSVKRYFKNETIIKIENYNKQPCFEIMDFSLFYDLEHQQINFDSIPQILEISERLVKNKESKYLEEFQH